MLCTTLLKNMQLISSDNMSLLFQTSANLNSDKCESQQILKFQNVTVYDEWCISVLNLFSCNLCVQRRTQANALAVGPLMLSARSVVSFCLDAKAIRQAD